MISELRNHWQRLKLGSSRLLGLFLRLALLGVAASCVYLVMGTRPAKGTYFSHATHSTEETGGGSCTACHVGVEASTDASRLPARKDNCGSCHATDMLAKVRLKPPNRSMIRFSHQKHVEEEGMDCGDCHSKVSTADYLPPRGGLPLMEDCGACHGDRLPDPNQPLNVAKNECRFCHQDEILPRNHYENWDKLHRVQGVAQWESNCQACHADKKGCTDCHAGGNFRPESHDLTFVQTHGFLVNNQIANCQSCHTTDTCQDCHRTHGVSGTPPYARRLGGNPHPPGYASDLPGSGRHHAMEARMKLESCKSCHIANDCQSCHVRRAPFPF